MALRPEGIKARFAKIIFYRTRFRMQNCSNHFHEWGRVYLPHSMINASALSETKWSGKGTEGDRAYRKIIVYAGLVPGSFPAPARTSGVE